MHNNPYCKQCGDDLKLADDNCVCNKCWTIFQSSFKAYVGNYWMPFPESEYGGMYVVIAKTLDEACVLLAECDGVVNRSLEYELIHSSIMESLGQSESFDIKADKSRIVKFFRT